MKSHPAEKLLYLLSPIGLLALWEGLLWFGIGDRRFIPSPSDISVQFWQVTALGELVQHTLVTLYRVFAGYFIGAVPAIVVGLLMAMLKPVRIFFDPLIACLFPIPKVALMPLLLLAFGSILAAYFVLSYPLMRLGWWLEGRLKRRPLGDRPLAEPAPFLRGA